MQNTREQRGTSERSPDMFVISMSVEYETLFTNDMNHNVRKPFGPLHTATIQVSLRIRAV